MNVGNTVSSDLVKEPELKVARELTAYDRQALAAAEVKRRRQNVKRAHLATLYGQGYVG